MRNISTACYLTVELPNVPGLRQIEQIKACKEVRLRRTLVRRRACPGLDPGERRRSRTQRCSICLRPAMPHIISDTTMTNIMRCGLLFLIAILLTTPSTNAQVTDTVAKEEVIFRLPSDDTFLVVIDHDFHNYAVITPTDTVVELSVGRHHLTIASRGSFDSIVHLNVDSDTLTYVDINKYPAPSRPSYPLHQHSSYPRLVWGATLAVHTDADATIFVNGEPSGTGRALLDLPEGDHDVVIVHPVFGRKASGVYVVDNRLTTADIYFRPDAGKMRSSAFLPGGAHFYRGQKLRGSVAFALVAGAVAGATHAHLKALPLNDEFTTVQRQYYLAVTENEVKARGDRAEELASSINNYRSRRNLMLGIAAGSYVLQLIDGVRRPRSGFREPIDHKYLLEPSFGADGAQLRFRYRF